MRIDSLFLFVLLLTSCRSHQVAFYFRLDNGTDEIDTYQGVMTRQYSDTTVQIRFDLTNDELKSISKYASKVKINKDLKLEDPRDCRGGQEIIEVPLRYYELEFSISANERKSLEWGNNYCNKPTIRRVKNFADSVHRMILRKSEFRNLKTSDILYM